MRTSALVAVVAAVGVLSVAGLAVAASPTAAHVLGMGTGNSTGYGHMGGYGGMGSGMHQNSYGTSQSGNGSGCPMDHHWDYNNSYDRGSCPCMG